MNLVTSHSISLPKISFSKPRELLNDLPHKFSSISYSACEHTWSYLSKIISLSRNTLNLTAASSKNNNFIYKTKLITTKLKLFSIINVPFNLVKLKLTAEKIFKSFQLSDREGVALSLLSFTHMAAETFDTTTGFVNTVLTLTATTVVKVFSTIALPLGFTVAGMGMVSKTIQLAKAANLYRNINKAAISGSDSKDKPKEFLEKKLGTTKELSDLRATEKDPTQIEQALDTIKEKKRAALLRAAPKDVVNELEKLLIDTKKDSFNDSQSENISRSLDKIKYLLVKKMKVDSANIFASSIALSSMVLSTIGTGGAILPLMLATSAVSLKLGSLIYEDRAKYVPSASIPEASGN